MVAFRNTDASGRTTGLLLRCVLYSLLALATDHRRQALRPPGQNPPACSRSSPIRCRLPSPRPSKAGTGFATASRPAMRCAPTRPSSKRSCASRSSGCSATRRWRPRRRGCARCATTPPGSPTASSSAMSWMWIWMRSASGCWSTKVRSDGVYRGPGGAGLGRRVWPGRAGRAAYQRSHSGQRRGACHTRCRSIAMGLRTIAVGTGDTEPAEAALPAHQRRRGCRRSIGDLRAGRRISRRLSGWHGRGGQARSGAVPGRRRRQTGCGARPLAGTACSSG